MKKRAAVLFLAVVLAVTLCPPAPALAAPPAQSYPFPDVAEDHWSYTYVLDLYEQEVLGGYPDGNFHPRDTLTWGQSFKLILGAIDVELPEREPGQHWAYSYIEPAIDNRLVYSFDEGSLDVKARAFWTRPITAEESGKWKSRKSTSARISVLCQLTRLRRRAPSG